MIFNNPYYIFCCVLEGGLFPGMHPTNQIRTSTCTQRRWQSLCASCTRGSYLDVFDVHLQMPARWQVGWNVLRSREPQLPARPRNRACVKFNSGRSVPTGSANSPSAPASVLNYKDDGRLRLVSLLPPPASHPQKQPPPFCCCLMFICFHVRCHLSTTESLKAINSTILSLKNKIKKYV